MRRLLVVFVLLVGCADRQSGFFVAPDSPGDDDGPSVVDDDDAGFEEFAGHEYLDLDYSEEAEALGAEDCTVGWAVEAAVDDESEGVCLSCDSLWRVEATRLPGASDCTDPLPTLDDPYTLRFGIRTLDDAEFVAFRTTWSGEDPWGTGAPELIRAGRGSWADEGSSFAWRAHDGDSRRIEGLDVVLSFSGDGAFR
jgi:hypothetical protein